MNAYKTIKGISEGTYKEKGSKFMAYLHPIQSDEEGKELVKYYKKEYYDARHVCYGLILADDGNFVKYNDDGEPAHTAGTPIVNVLKSANLTYCIAIVVRYFGGTKLGVPGLIEAYKQATLDAVSRAEIITKRIFRSLWIQTDYQTLNEFMYQLKKHEVSIGLQYFDNEYTQLEFCIPNENMENFRNLLSQQYKIQIIDPSDIKG